MKKVSFQIAIFLVVISLMCLLLTQESGFAVKSDKIEVLTSLPLVKNIVEKVGGNKVAVQSIIQGPSCDHQYEPSAGDMKKLAKCGAFFKIGMGSDPWADKLAKGIMSKQSLFIDPSKGIKLMKVRGLENPHYWGSPDNVKIMAQNILDGLGLVSPKDKDYFTNNYRKYVREIEQTDTELKARVTRIKNKQLVSYSGAFPYFFQYFGFKNLMTVELSCEQEVSPKDIAEATKLMQVQNIKIIIGDAAEPNEPDGLAQEVHASKVLLWGTTDRSGDYLTTLRHNIALLENALQ